MEQYTLTPEMIAVLAIIGFTLVLFVSKRLNVRVDVAAVTAMVTLGLTNMIWPFIFGEGRHLLNFKDLFSGFASNAVISIIAVIIIGAGLDKTGVMSKVASFIMNIGGTTEKRIIPLISGTVGVISSVMQNIGAAALFLPVVSRISTRTGLPMSRLLMPMGFCAILGGTMTMIGSSPLILLNDLILSANKSLPDGVDVMQTFGMFDVTPVGLALLATGIIYFVIAGRFVLPDIKREGGDGSNTVEYFRDIYGIEGDIFEAVVLDESQLLGKTVADVEAMSNYTLYIIGHDNKEMRLAPARDVEVTAGTVLALVGGPQDVQLFAANHGLRVRKDLTVFAETLIPARSGIAEIVIPPNSNLIGKSPSEVRMRKTYGLNVLAIYRAGETIRQGFRELIFQAGDTLVAHTTWDNLAALDKNHKDFVVVTSDYPHEELRPHKVKFALAFFAIAMVLALFSRQLGIPLSLALFVGALGMILSGVLSMDEAYKGVSWMSVFLLASLFPLGAAMSETHTAAWIAQETLSLINTFGDAPIWVLQAVLALLATALTLAASNVGATVLLVPIAVNMAIGAGADPRIFALTVAIATSNSFIIPTHQVNALIMGPAGYDVNHFLKAGSIMTVLFLIVMIPMLNLVF
jgi:di/tricarboxylate transporter